MADKDDCVLPTRRPWLRVLLICGVMLSLAGVAFADTLGARQVKRLGNQAEQALERGDLEGARKAYGEIVEGSGLSEPLRAEALWYLALDALTRHDDIPQRTAASREYLETLLEEHTSFPRRGQVRALSALLGQLDDLDRHRREAARLARRLAEREEEIAAASAELAEIEENDDETKSSLESQIADQRRRRDEAERERDLCKEDLQKKEQALQKLKDALVGGGG